MLYSSISSPLDVLVCVLQAVSVTLEDQWVSPVGRGPGDVVADPTWRDPSVTCE